MNKTLDMKEFDNVTPGSVFDEYLKEYEKIAAEAISPEKNMIVEPQVWCTMRYLEDAGFNWNIPSDTDYFLELCDELAANEEFEMLEAIRYTVKKIIDSENDF